jgi:hypothetical protein
MTGLTARRLRLLRLRSIEHRVASAKLASADVALSKLIDVANRIVALRGQLNVGEGESNGSTLRTVCEMSQRLDGARSGLAGPMSDARATREECRALRAIANRKKESAAKLHEHAARTDAVLRERRADANRPYRPRSSKIGDES